jgi:PAS domain S-box-containing protein
MSAFSNEAARLEALKTYQVLDSLPERDFDRITELAAIICNTPISLISLIDENRQWFKSVTGPVNVSETPREYAFCNHVLENAAIFEVEDATNTEFFSDNPFVTGDPHIRYYCGFPLIDSNGFTLGTLCVMDTVPRKLDERQKTVLRLLSEDVMALISDRRQREELKHFEKLFNLSNDIICVAGLDGYFKKANPAFKILLGYDSDFILETKFLDMIHPDDLEATQLEMLKLGAGITTLNFVNRFRKSDGDYIHIEWTATPETGTQFLFCIGRDVSKEVAREQQLQYSEKHFREFFEYSKGLMCTHDMEGNFLTVNSASALGLGYTKDEMSSMSLFDIVPAYLHRQLAQYLADIKEKGSFQGIMRTMHKDGSFRIWLFNNIRSEDLNGQTHVIGNALDITGQHDLELEFNKVKEMLEQTNRVARVGGWEVDFVRNEAYWSSIMREIHEVPDDYVPSMNLDTEFYKKGNSRNAIVKAIKEAKISGTPSDLELEFVTAKGKEIWVRTQIKAEFENKVCVRLYGTFQDITETCLQREELEAARKQAEKANSAKSEFIANMSHEIRTPLNGVIGFTELLRKTSMTDTQTKYVSIVNQSANSLLSVINDILDFSKIEAGKLDLDIDRVDIFDVVNQAIDIITFQAQNKRLELLLNISPDLPRFIWADSVRLKQVLVNLLGNAVKFTESGEVELKVYVVSEDIPGRSTIGFDVRDTGIGIKPDKQKKIFEAFSQEDVSTTKKYGGTGLGITISNNLLNLMDSSLTLESEPGVGTTFTFFVDVRSERGEPVTSTVIAGIKKVLVVDDNDNNRAIIRGMLDLKNIEVVEAANGFEALQLIAEGADFDVIMMDYHMPMMDGLDTVRKIRENFQINPGKQPFILFNSSSDDEKIAGLCEQLGITHRLVKPVKMQELYSVLAGLSFNNDQTTAHDQQLGNLLKSAGKQLKILIADDNKVNSMLARTMLLNLLPNARILEVENGIEAITEFDRFMPDLIFMDVQMPVMNGYDATKLIRQKSFGITVPIIALTAGNLKGERENCLEAGMNDYITKPFAENTLRLMIEKWNNGNVPGDSDSEHFDIEKLKKQLCGDDDDEDTIQEFLSLALEELKSYIYLINSGIHVNKKPEYWKLIGHKLYGMSSSIGLKELAKIAAQLEHPGDDDSIISILTALLKEIEIGINLISRHVK